MRNILIYFLILISYSNAISQIINDSLKINPLHKYLLEDAKKYNSFYEVSLVRLASCEDEDEIYNQMLEAAKIDAKFCFSLLKNNYLYRIRHCYYDLIIHKNLQLVEKLCDVCNLTLTKNDLDSFAIKNQINTQYYAKNNINGHFDKVVKSLDTILFEDQFYRKITKCLVGDTLNNLVNERKKSDKKNLVKIKEIISEYNYLTKDEVGLMHENTIFLVLHHQSDCTIRKEYFSYLENLFKIAGIGAVNLELYLGLTNKLCGSD